MPPRSKPLRARVWIVLTDGEEARIVTPSIEGIGFDAVAEFTAPDADPADPGADAARRSAFLRSVASHLNKEAARTAFDQLILFSPAEPLQELRDRLDPAVQPKIKAARATDLTRVPLADLTAYLPVDRDAVD